MKEFGAKFLELLVNKNWIITGLSLLFGSSIYLLFCRDYEDKMPFENNDWNVLFLIVLLSLAVYMVLTLIRFLYKRQTSNHKDKLYTEQQQLEIINQKTEEIKTEMDQLTDYDYSVIWHLVKNGNKIPYKEIEKNSLFTINYNTSVFVSSPYKRIPYFPYGDEYYNQYLLTDRMYKILSEILHRTGNLSHFDRKIVEMDENFK